MPSPHNEYPTNGQEQMHYLQRDGKSAKMDEPSDDGTEERVSNNQSYELYNDTDLVTPDGGGEKAHHNQEYEQYNDTALANPEAFASPAQVEEEESVANSKKEKNKNG